MDGLDFLGRTYIVMPTALAQGLKDIDMGSLTAVLARSKSSGCYIFRGCLPPRPCVSTTAHKFSRIHPVCKFTPAGLAKTNLYFL